MARSECREYCGRRAAKGSEFCCSRCERNQGYGDHTEKCDEREVDRTESCAMECGRVASKDSAGGYCCKRCAQGSGHTAKCDDREESR